MPTFEIAPNLSFILMSQLQKSYLGGLKMKHWSDCNCSGAVFVQHIMEHLRVGDEVVCKICDKTVREIELENAHNKPVDNDTRPFWV